MNISVNYKKITQELKRLSSETYQPILIAVTKYVDCDTIKKLADLGHNDIGENRVDVMMPKKAELSHLNIRWHFIGTLQSRKVKTVINEIDVLHSLDRISTAKEIFKHRIKPLDCFVQVKISDDESKQGVKPDELLEFISLIKTYSEKIKIVGLMAMTSLLASDSQKENEFNQVVQLQKEVKNLKLDYAPCEFLSMGMSNDYNLALKAGATHIRIGSALYEK